MNSESDNKVIQLDIFIQDSDGFYVPLRAVCKRLEEKKQRIQTQKEIAQNRLVILKKMVKNNRYEKMRFFATFLLGFLSLGIVFHPNRQVQKTGAAIAGATFGVSAIAGLVLARHYKKLQEQDSYWKKQEQGLERS